MAGVAGNFGRHHPKTCIRSYGSCFFGILFRSSNLGEVESVIKLAELCFGGTLSQLTAGYVSWGMRYACIFLLFFLGQTCENLENALDHICAERWFPELKFLAQESCHVLKINAPNLWRLELTILPKQSDSTDILVSLWTYFGCAVACTTGQAPLEYKPVCYVQNIARLLNRTCYLLILQIKLT